MDAACTLRARGEHTAIPLRLFAAAVNGHLSGMARLEYGYNDAVTFAAMANNHEHNRCLLAAGTSRARRVPAPPGNRRKKRWCEQVLKLMC